MSKNKRKQIHSVYIWKYVNVYINLDTQICSWLLGSGPFYFKLFFACMTFSPCLFSLNSKKDSNKSCVSSFVEKFSWRLLFQKLPRVLLPAGRSEWRGEKSLSPQEAWRIPLPQPGNGIKRDNNQGSHLDVACLFLKLVPYTLINCLRLCRQEKEGI